jgi:uncharacterized protein
MLTEPLPRTLDVRKAAARGVSIGGTLKVLDLQRFRPLLAGDEGVVQARLAFSRDEENRFLVSLEIDVDVLVTCQRCLEPMSVHVASGNVLAVVGSDEQAAQLPRHLDPLIVEGEACNLWDVVEDELILAIPSFNYHPPGECKQIEAGLSQPSVDEDGEGRPNPFDVLAQLKPGSK